MKRRSPGAAVAVAVVIVLAAVGLSVAQAPAATGAAAIPYLWQNCTHVHTKYRHGVGKVGAHDRTTGTIGELVGHDDLVTTARTYTHVVAEGELDYAAMLT